MNLAPSLGRTVPAGSPRTLGVRDFTSIVRILVTAFEDDQAFKWIVRIHFVRAVFLRYLFITDTLAIFMLGRIDGWYREGRLVAVCMWRNPNRYPFPWYVQLVMTPLILPFFLLPGPVVRLSRFQEAAKKLTPRDREHWYVGGLGVVPEFRQLGIGSALLRSGLPKTDVDDRPVVLACWSALVGYYAQLGFSESNSTEVKGYPDTLHGLWMLKDDQPRRDEVKPK